MSIHYGEWPAYSWKNELATQVERVKAHFAEMVAEEFDGEHSPLDMLDRAIVLAAFAIRRMVEKRLVTDKLRDEEGPVRAYPSRAANFRPRFVGRCGGEIFRSYDLEHAGTTPMKVGDLANEIIHASHLMVVHGEARIPTGLLIASDWNLKKRLLHLTIEEFSAAAQRVLDDRVTAATESWDPATGKVIAMRK